jgi:hypothetical protein
MGMTGLQIFKLLPNNRWRHLPREISNYAIILDKAQGGLSFTDSINKHRGRLNGKDNIRVRKPVQLGRRREDFTLRQ